MERNGRKRQVLEYARNVAGEFTSEDVSNDLDLEIHHARMCLLRYHKQGLLSRKHGASKVYCLTEKGLNRLLWLGNR